MLLRRESGFSLIELMIVVLIIGILVALATPVYAQTRQTAMRRACFANQRAIQGAIIQYSARSNGDLTAVVGVVDGNHVFIDEDIFAGPPTCPAAPRAANPAMPTVAEGAYVVQANGSVAACTFATPAHGAFQ